MLGETALEFLGDFQIDSPQTRETNSKAIRWVQRPLVGSYLKKEFSLFTFKISLNSEVYLLVPHIVCNTVQ